MQMPLSLSFDQFPPKCDTQPSDIPIHTNEREKCREFKTKRRTTDAISIMQQHEHKTQDSKS